MNCIIVEDGSRALTHLENLLSASGFDVHVEARLDSVESAVEWLRKNTTELIFLDIQLGDGLSFEIFDHVDVSTPVIFTTSYDQYLIRAFELNSIAYLLKPVKISDLAGALAKFEKLYKQPAVPEFHQAIAPLHKSYQKRFMVHKGNIIRSIPVEEVKYAHIQSKGLLVVVTATNEQHLVESTLDKLEQRLDPALFFRINRQFIVNINAIDSMIPIDPVRIRIMIKPDSKEEMIVSSKRIKQFREWISQ